MTEDKLLERRAQLLSEFEQVQSKQAELQALFNVYEGALQEIDYWLQQTEEDSE
jgi:hypothetical protein